MVSPNAPFLDEIYRTNASVIFICNVSRKQAQKELVTRGREIVTIATLITGGTCSTFGMARADVMIS